MERIHKIRKQLSMYVPCEMAQEVEAVRRVVDPIQHSLIPAHITLCREDELNDLAILKNRLRDIPFHPLTLSFGEPEVFSEHGLLLNCISGEETFRSLREYLLGSAQIRNQKPHLTLAHPRNPKSVGNLLSHAARLPDILTITFPMIYLIEQQENAPWQLLGKYELLD